MNVLILAYQQFVAKEQIVRWTSIQLSVFVLLVCKETHWLHALKQDAVVTMTVRLMKYVTMLLDLALLGKSVHHFADQEIVLKEQIVKPGIIGKSAPVGIP